MTPEEKMTETEYQELLKLIGDPGAKTNKSAARIALENEQEILRHGDRAVDLSLIPQNQHHLYNQREVTVPPEVADFLSDCEYPLSADAIHMIEKKMDKAHNVAEPHGIGMSLPMQQTGKPGTNLPQLVSEGIITGFSYFHHT